MWRHSRPSLTARSWSFLRCCSDISAMTFLRRHFWSTDIWTVWLFLKICNFSLVLMRYYNLSTCIFIAMRFVQDASMVVLWCFSSPWVLHFLHQRSESESCRHWKLLITECQTWSIAKVSYQDSILVSKCTVTVNLDGWHWKWLNGMTDKEMFKAIWVNRNFS